MVDTRTSVRGASRGAAVGCRVGCPHRWDKDTLTDGEGAPGPGSMGLGHLFEGTHWLIQWFHTKADTEACIFTSKIPHAKHAFYAKVMAYPNQKLKMNKDAVVPIPPFMHWNDISIRNETARRQKVGLKSEDCQGREKIISVLRGQTSALWVSFYHWRMTGVSEFRQGTGTMPGTTQLIFPLTSPLLTSSLMASHQFPAFCSFTRDRSSL